MKIIKKIILLLLLTATVSLFGQTSSDSKIENPYIEVNGIAEMEIIPDEIYIAITLRERHEGRKKITIEKQEKMLKDALKSIEVSIDNLVLSDANANYIPVKWSKKDVISNIKPT